jgi:RecA-family ATPase
MTAPNAVRPDWEALCLWGFSVFPLHPRDKKAAVPWAAYQKERAAGKLVKQWADDRRGLNAAVVTGAVSGVIVLDTDSAEAEAEVQRRGAPCTPTVKTAKGRHRYFKHPGFAVRNFAGRIPGCDLRGDGGYVVAAGSVHPSGAVYAWEITPDEAAFAPVPDWLLDLIRAPTPTAEAPPAPNNGPRSAYAEKALDGELAALRRAQQGGRNDALNRSAFNLGQLVGADALSQGEAERHLLATALAIGLDEKEARATIASGIEDGKANPRQIPERRQFEARAHGGGRSGAPVSSSGAAGRAATAAAPVADLTAERERRRRALGDDAPVLAPIDPITWHGRNIPERRWIVPDWIPHGTVTAIYGDGGVGKTLVAQQLLTACALGRPWLGKETTPCRAMGFLCEDGADELHRRQAAICAHYGAALGDLENMRLFSRVADDNLLMTFDADGTGRVTPLYEELLAAAKSFGAQVLVIDTAADVFGGNENIRNQVRQFIAALTRVAMEIDGAVILCAHPSIDGMSKGHGFAGSTAWNNSVRSRLYLTRPAEDEAGAVDPEERLLTRMKANYAAAGEAIRLRWKDGALVSEEPETGLFAHLAKNKAERVFLEALDALDAQGRPVSDSHNAVNHAPKTMRKAGMSQGVSERDLAQAMERLFKSGAIMVVKEGRHQTRKIVRGSFRSSG